MLPCGSASALSGNANIGQAWNDYVWLYTGSGAQRWESNTFGQNLYSGASPVNGLAFNVSLDTLATYGTYTTGYIELTMEFNGGGYTEEIANTKCETWTTAPNQYISSSMGILREPYPIENGKYAVDYRCTFESTGLVPAYTYLRIGNDVAGQNVNVMLADYGPNTIFAGLKIRNVSYHYNTSNEGIQEGLSQQLVDNTGDLINGQKVIDNSIHEEGQNIVEAINNMNNEEETATAEASDDAAQAADDAGAEAEENTSNLIENITTVVDAVKNAEPTDCVINLDLGNVNLGNVDLCNAPQGVKSAVTTVIAIPMTIAVLKIAYSLVNIYLDKIREEQK